MSIPRSSIAAKRSGPSTSVCGAIRGAFTPGKRSFTSGNMQCACTSTTFTRLPPTLISLRAACAVARNDARYAAAVVAWSKNCRRVGITSSSHAPLRRGYSSRRSARRGLAPQTRDERLALRGELALEPLGAVAARAGPRLGAVAVAARPAMRVLHARELEVLLPVRTFLVER